MQSQEFSIVAVGYNITNPPLTRWVCQDLPAGNNGMPQSPQTCGLSTNSAKLMDRRQHQYK